MDIGRELIQKRKYKTKRICSVLGISRSNQYENKKTRSSVYKKADDAEVLKSILVVSKNRATYGYPRVTALINRERRKSEKPVWNEKRVLRVMRINKLILTKYSNKPKRLHLGQVMTIRSNVRWCTDILEIRCWNGEKVFIGFSMDCHDREVMGFVAQRRALFHHDIIELIDKSVTHRFGEFVEKLPNQIQWLSDQGPQYTAKQTVAYAEQWGFDVRTTPSYSPESNGMAEAFVKLFKNDYVYSNEVWTADSVLRCLPEWFDDYNRNHPHSGLQMRSPLEYREALTKKPEVYV